MVGTVRYFRDGTALSAELTAIIRYLVSERAGCRFCIDLNEGFLSDMGVDLDRVRAARIDVTQAPVAEPE